MRIREIMSTPAITVQPALPSQPLPRCWPRRVSPHYR